MSILTNNTKILVFGKKIITNEPSYVFTPFNIFCKNIKSSGYDKIIIAVRHSARPLQDWSDEVHLTDLGIAEAKRAGSDLKELDDNIDYYSTNTMRTKETAMYISNGREDDKCPSINSVLDFYSTASGLNYIKDQTLYNNYIDTYGYNNVWYGYMYDNKYLDAFNDISIESNKFINSSLNNTKLKVNIMVSHDQNLMPLVVYGTNSLIDFKKNNRWINFISGLAILQKNNDIFCIPITGLPTGFN